MDKLNDELAKIVSEAKKHRGGIPPKYDLLDKYGEDILKLIESNVQLPFILKWLIDEKKEKLVLNTLRSYVIKKIGRDQYENYLKRNGWLKSKKAGVVAKAESPQKETIVTEPTAVLKTSESEKPAKGKFDFEIPPKYIRATKT